MPNQPHATVTRKAYAKLNLILSVGAAEPQGSEKPGWHKIASWMTAIDLADDLAVTPLPAGTPTTIDRAWAADAPQMGQVGRTSPAIDWPVESDLVFRAHKLLEEAAGRALPARIELRKRIPAGAGLGGGSSDAAATLLALRDAFELPMDDAALAALSAKLGSDVPFFVDAAETSPRPALITGFGAVAERVTRTPAQVLLVLPPYGCATPEVYKAFDVQLKARMDSDAMDRNLGLKSGRLPQTGARDELVATRLARTLAFGAFRDDWLFNDLAIPAFATEPRLGEVVKGVANLTRHAAHVSGSGSAFFLIPKSGKIDWLEEHARRIIGTIDPANTPAFVRVNLL